MIISKMHGFAVLGVRATIVLNAREIQSARTHVVVPRCAAARKHVMQDSIRSAAILVKRLKLRTVTPGHGSRVREVPKIERVVSVFRADRFRSETRDTLTGVAAPESRFAHPIRNPTGTESGPVLAETSRRWHRSDAVACVRVEKF